MADSSIVWLPAYGQEAVVGLRYPVNGRRILTEQLSWTLAGGQRSWMIIPLVDWSQHGKPDGSFPGLGMLVWMRYSQASGSVVE